MARANEQADHERDETNGCSGSEAGQHVADDPRRDPDDSRPQKTAQQRMEQLAQHDQDDEANEKIIGGPAGPRRRSTLRRRHGFTVDQPDDAVGARIDASLEIPLLERRDDFLLDDALGDRIGNRAFEPVADLDADFPVILGDQQQHAVVHPSASEPPLLEDADCILLDSLGLRRGHQQHCDLAALARFQRRELLLERGAFAGAEGRGEVGDAGFERRDRDLRRSELRRNQHYCREGRSQQPTQDHGTYFAGPVAGAAGLPKSTFGALLISFSFSTVNCGFSLKPKTIAVRFVGNRTTTVLYSCTALM